MAAFDEWEALDEIDPARHATVRADRDPADIVDEIEAFLDHRSGARGVPPAAQRPVSVDRAAGG